MRSNKKTMLIIISVILIIVAVAAIAIFFNIPWSRAAREFEATAERLLADARLAGADLTGTDLASTDLAITNPASASTESGVFTEEDIAHLPLPVQKYFRYCGYIGTPKMSAMKIEFKDVRFSMGPNKPTIKIDYTQYNFVNAINRIAYIDSSMFGIPFEGLDAYIDGKGSMKGMLAKLFTLFNQTGRDMDRAALVTFLSESLVIPSAALQEYVSWQAIDDLHAQASISYKGISVSGIFTFDENGALRSFTTNDRVATGFDGKSAEIRWSAILADYVERDGIKVPNVLQAIWHYPEGDLLYFDSKDIDIQYM